MAARPVALYSATHRATHRPTNRRQHRTQPQADSMMPAGEPGQADPERPGTRWYVVLLSTVVAVTAVWWIAEQRAERGPMVSIASDER